MARPVLAAVYDDPKVLTALDQALQTRFGADYQAHPRQARARHLPSRAVPLAPGAGELSSAMSYCTPGQGRA
jgi:hypothetical protein